MLASFPGPSPAFHTLYRTRYVTEKLGSSLRLLWLWCGVLLARKMHSLVPRPRSAFCRLQYFVCAWGEHGNEATGCRLASKNDVQIRCHEHARAHTHTHTHTLTLTHTHTHTQYKQSMMKHLTVLVNEKGLDSQNYHCAGCTRPIGISKLYLPHVCTSIQRQ